MRMLRQSISKLIIAALALCFCLCHVRVSADPNEISSEVILRWEKIFVNIESEPTLSLMVDPEATVVNLLEDMRELEGIEFRLGNQTGDVNMLDLGAKLLEYIRAGTPVNLVTAKRTNGNYTTEFIVRTRDGRKLPIKTQLDYTVASLKNNITQWTGIAQEQQRLLLRGKELKDGRRLINHLIYNGTRLHLGRPLEECHQVATIFVKTLSGATIAVEANLADTATDLKEKISEKTGVPTGVQRLFTINAAPIAGEDHLCDIELETDSIVYMMLYTPRIASLDEFSRLREPPVARPSVNPNRAPIFREAEDVAEPVHSDHSRLFRDERNWVAREGPRNYGDIDLFDPIAHLSPNPDHEDAIRDNLRDLENALSPNASEWDRLEASIYRARVKLISAVRPYRLAANLTSDKRRQYPGISLGGGSTDGSAKQLVPLGADVNNWAPDAFSDLDVMRLFEVAERVRLVLAKASQTGEGILAIDSQRQINTEILSTYTQALAGYLPPVEHSQPREDEECGVCRDELSVEPAIKLPCEHTFHADCILSWVSDLYARQYVPSCPSCRQRFMFPYEAQGKATLGRAQLAANQDK